MLDKPDNLHYNNYRKKQKINNLFKEDKKMARYTEMELGIMKAEERGAAKRGMTVAEFRTYQAKANKAKTYHAKIARYTKAIAEMQAWLDENQM